MRLLELNENIGAYMLITLVVAALVLLLTVVFIAANTSADVECEEPCDLCCTTYTDNNVISFHCTEAGEPLKIGENP